MEICTAALLGGEAASFNVIDLWNRVMGLRREVNRLVVLLGKQTFGGPFVSELSCMVCGFQLKARKEWAHSTKDLLGVVEGIPTDEV